MLYTLVFHRMPWAGTTTWKAGNSCTPRVRKYLSLGTKSLFISYSSSENFRLAYYMDNNRLLTLQVQVLWLQNKSTEVQVQVLNNVYLSVLKYKYQCTWPQAWRVSVPYVRVKNSFSDTLPVLSGVPQGSILHKSFILCSVYKWTSFVSPILTGIHLCQWYYVNAWDIERIQVKWTFFKKTLITSSTGV